MKKIFAALMLLAAFVSIVHAQDVNSLLNSFRHKKNNGSDNGLSTDAVASGLKEALDSGVQKGTAKLSAVDGFFADAAVKILLPPEAVKVESTLRNMGLGQQVDDAILSMNRAAEDAAKSAAPIFLDAITKMTIGDAWGILKGGDTSATHYLRGKTTDPLTAAFSPIIKQSLDKVNATKYWGLLFNTYNEIPFVSKVNPDLTSYVTGKGLTGIYYEISLEEKNIRKNPIARTTALLQQVFGQL